LALLFLLLALGLTLLIFFFALLPLSNHMVTLFLLFLSDDFLLGLALIAFKHLDFLQTNPFDVTKEQLLFLEFDHLRVEILLGHVFVASEQTDRGIGVVKLLLKCDNFGAERALVVDVDLLLLLDLVDLGLDVLDHFL
jgi:hypothetical protein